MVSSIVRSGRADRRPRRQGSGLGRWGRARFRWCSSLTPTCPSGPVTCLDSLWDRIETSDVVVHAGDWVDVALLDELERRPAGWSGCTATTTTVRCACGCPRSPGWRSTGLRFAVVHETGAAPGRERRCAERFPDVDVLVFGHSHIPWDTTTGTGPAAAQPRLAHRPAPAAARHLPHRHRRRRPARRPRRCTGCRSGEPAPAARRGGRPAGVPGLRAGLAADVSGLRCATGHAFDRARQGHVTLLPAGGSPHEGDSAAMVADRAGVPGRRALRGDHRRAGRRRAGAGRPGHGAGRRGRDGRPPGRGARPGAGRRRRGAGRLALRGPPGGAGASPGDGGRGRLLGPLAGTGRRAGPGPGGLRPAQRGRRPRGCCGPTAGSSWSPRPRHTWRSWSGRWGC